MPAGALSRTQRLFLLCALAFGVLLMHHVDGPGAMPGAVETVAGEPSPAAAFQAAEPHHACDHCDIHEMTHVCLAVLDGTLLALLAFAAFSAVGAPAAPNPRGAPRPGRPPDLHGRAALTSLCVLRV
ncbi:DUF6153 family protein [Amycolatopsis sp. NPDC005003]